MTDPQTMLIVEENPQVARAMTAHFEDLGYAVASAPDGLDAVMKIRSRPPRVVLMGLTTPRLGGVDAVRLLRRWQPGLSIVLTDPARLSAMTERRADWQSIDRLVALATVEPLRNQATADAGRPAPPPPAPRPDPTRVLVIDAAEETRRDLRDALAGEGYDVDVASTATAAITQLASRRPRVILLDIEMPGLSGLSALQQLRARDPEVGVILVIGAGDESLARQMLALGAFDYVRRPIDREYLRGSVRTLLAMRAALAAGAGSASG